MPHGVSVLVGSHSRLVDGLVVLVPDIEDHDRTVVATGGDEGRPVGVEVNAHHTALCGELVFGPGEVLNSVTADETTLGVEEVIRTVRNTEKVLIPGVPGDGRHVLSAALVRSETPQREHINLSSLAGNSLFHGQRFIFIVHKSLLISVLYD